MHQEIIRTIGLTKAYRTHLGFKAPPSIEDLYLSVKRGEVYGFLGKNGAGKTTTIKILCGLIKPTRGEARINSVDVRKRAARKYVGYLPENPYFYEYLTPKETIEFYGKLRGLSKADRNRTWDRLSEEFRAGEAGDDVAVAEAPDLARRGLDDGVAHADLAVAGNDHGTTLAHAQNRRAAPARRVRFGHRSSDVRCALHRRRSGGTPTCGSIRRAVKSVAITRRS